MSDTNTTSLALSIAAIASALVGVCVICAKRMKRCRSACCDAEMNTATPPPTRQPTETAAEDTALLRAAVEVITRSRANSGAPAVVVTDASRA